MKESLVFLFVFFTEYRIIYVACFCFFRFLDWKNSNGIETDFFSLSNCVFISISEVSYERLIDVEWQIQRHIEDTHEDVPEHGWKYAEKEKGTIKL